MLGVVTTVPAELPGQVLDFRDRAAFEAALLPLAFFAPALVLAVCFEAFGARGSFGSRGVGSSTRAMTRASPPSRCCASCAASVSMS